MTRGGVELIRPTFLVKKVATMKMENGKPKRGNLYAGEG